MLNNGCSYLHIAESPKDVMKFIDAISKSKRCVVISRISPGKRKNIVKSLWLTEINTEISHINPKEIEQLCYDAEKIIAENKGIIIVLEGVEYLITHNSFKEIFHLINKLKDLAYVNKSVFLAVVGKNTLCDEEKNMLMHELNYLGDIHGNN
jgi:archaellum biogenesis ATPase FlaH